MSKFCSQTSWFSVYFPERTSDNFRKNSACYGAYVSWASLYTAIVIIFISQKTHGGTLGPIEIHVTTAVQLLVFTFVGRYFEEFKIPLKNCTFYFFEILFLLSAIFAISWQIWRINLIRTWRSQQKDVFILIPIWLNLHPYSRGMWRNISLCTDSMKYARSVFCNSIPSHVNATCFGLMICQ